MSSPLRGTPVYQLAVKQPFDSLDHESKIYAHYLARAVWHGSRISLRETSRESPLIFDLILDLYHACEGKWDTIVTRCGVTRDELEVFLEYAGTFLSHLGNVSADGREKLVPELSTEALKRIASISPKTTADLEKAIDGLLGVRPPRPKYPGESVRLGFYPREALSDVSDNDLFRIWHTIREAQNIVDGIPASEWSITHSNTQLQPVIDDNGKTIYHILLASELGACDEPRILAEDIRLIRGVHSEELSHICNALDRAKKWAPKEQHATLDHYLNYFRTGHNLSLQAAQKAPTGERVESFLGFVNPLHNCAGEWNGMVGIFNQDEQSKLNQIVNSSSALIRQLPWAVPGVNGGKGPFETFSFDAPRLARLHTLAMCGRIVFQDAKPESFHEDRWICHFRNTVFANRLNEDTSSTIFCDWISPLNTEHFRRSIHLVSFIITAVHQLIGHGTGKLLGRRIEDGCRCNFNEEMPPISPLTGKPIASVYPLGKSWEDIFPSDAKSVEECRATLVSQYLMDSKEILAIFGYSETSEITSEDLLYTSYLKICVDGIQALQYYGIEGRPWPVWETDHPVAKANFTILKYLLQNGSGVIKITHDREASTITASVDRTKMLSHGKAALGDYLLRLHIWRCTGDTTPCRELYESLSTVDGIYGEWREIVSSKRAARWKFVQPNTFLTVDNEVELRVYEESNEGIIRSWAERDVQAKEEKIQRLAEQDTRDKEEVMVERDVKPKMENLSLEPGRGMHPEEDNIGDDNIGDAQPRAGVRASVKSFVQKIVHRN